MPILNRRHFLRSLLCAAPAVVVAANLMPVRLPKLLLPPKPELVVDALPKIIVSEEAIMLGFQYGTVVKLASTSAQVRLVGLKWKTSLGA